MALKKSEQTVCEAIDTMLRHKVALGLQDLPEDAQKEEEHSFQYLHEQINEMFAIKAAGLTHHDGVCAAFRKVHNYKYITDPTFRRSVSEEMQSQGVPAEERTQVLKYIPAIIDDIKKGDDWCERDAGYHPNLAEILKAGRGVSESIFKENCGMCEEDTYNKPRRTGIRIKKTNLADEDNVVVTHHTAMNFEQFIAQEVRDWMVDDDLSPGYGRPMIVTPRIEGRRAWITWEPGDGGEYTIAEYEVELDQAE